MKKSIILVLLLCSGCASWCTSPEELAEMRARQLASNSEIPEHCHMEQSDGFDRLVCKDIPPEPKEGKTCEKLAANMYYCH